MPRTRASVQAGRNVAVLALAWVLLFALFCTTRAQAVASPEDTSGPTALSLVQPTALTTLTKSVTATTDQGQILALHNERYISQIPTTTLSHIRFFFI